MIAGAAIVGCLHAAAVASARLHDKNTLLQDPPATRRQQPWLCQAGTTWPTVYTGDNTTRMICVLGQEQSTDCLHAQHIIVSGSTHHAWRRLPAATKPTHPRTQARTDPSTHALLLHPRCVFAVKTTSTKRQMLRFSACYTSFAGRYSCAPVASETTQTKDHPSRGPMCVPAITAGSQVDMCPRHLPKLLRGPSHSRKEHQIMPRWLAGGPERLLP